MHVENVISANRLFKESKKNIPFSINKAEQIIFDLTWQAWEKAISANRSFQELKKNNPFSIDKAKQIVFDITWQAWNRQFLKKKWCTWKG